MSMNKKRVYIIHGWGFKPKQNWYPWLKEKLEKEGFEVFAPQMPDSDEPKIEAWVDRLEGIVGKPDEQTYFAGHSIGCQTILRYLEKQDQKVGGVVCVAGWFNLAGLEEEGEEVVDIARPWIETPIDFGKVKHIAPKIKVILSDNDPYGFVEENKKIFEEKLGAKVTILKNKGHFTEVDGIIEFPEVLAEFLKLAASR
ncbi:hypothetical protein A2824_02775 [Candidatus Nomurabacteria bacterium RIFCSPHIGHO2_01_FULL_42_16]|uniref:Serine hydrolase family protein n=1 Tax=Candidatus Nomurabacteria bacterium RIFCSPHIGHO2_01_FULL_42_16 TaxID=1801743 RepID=A0A1F6VIT5_9BACT|nr:MAG: hypothetical protein A2824_02775 [Candidatus Nomurabacteria bacterium RIFCSPHIGHO2_01_FULL_42_16]